MNKKLLKILVCPVCKGRLIHRSAGFGLALLKRGDDQLVCERDGLVFPVHDGIPMLNVQDARRLDAVK